MSQTSKIVLAVIITAVIVGAGIYLWQTSQTNQQNEPLSYYNDLFSVELPAPYTEKDSVIQPTSQKDFPTIIFGSSKEKIEAGKLLEFEKEWFKNLCSQTDSCGKIISSENVTINGKNGIKFTVQYQGRSLDDRSGYLNEYHYSSLNAENLFRFWTSASDLENPEEINMAFNKIIKTILFK